MLFQLRAQLVALRFLGGDETKKVRVPETKSEKKPTKREGSNTRSAS